MDCTWDILHFLSQDVQFPEKLRKIVQHGTNREFLAALSEAALTPSLTETIFVHFESLSLEICSRWVSRDLTAVVEAFARIITTLPHLSDVAQRIFSSNENVDLLSGLKDGDDQNCRECNRNLLIAVFRLLNFDNDKFAQFIRPAKLQWYLQHDDRSLRYLAIRVISQYIHASDAVLEDMMAKYMGLGPAPGPLGDKFIDFTFLSLWEHKRLTEFRDHLNLIRGLRQTSSSVKTLRIVREEDFSESVGLLSGILLHRACKSSVLQENNDHFVPTSTSLSNMKSISEALTGTEPLLLTGPAGCGKTFLASYIADKLGKASSMITLHLNEQSDAKLLVGIYTTGSQPGSFQWQPGVLTTAVAEGRWVLIEDLDRAPNEVMSTLLPLVERGELSVPSRGQKMFAASGFRIIATMRSIKNLSGEISAPIARLLGKRFWRIVPLDAPKGDEMREVILMQYPILQRFIDQIMSVYYLLSDEGLLFDGVSRSQAKERPISPRELLKWADRINAVLSRSGSKNGREAIPESAMDSIFLDAVDCFTGHLADSSLRETWISAAAKELRIDPQRRKYLVASRPVTLKRQKSDLGSFVKVGRAILNPELVKSMTSSQISSHFAVNGYSLRLLERVATAVERREPLLLVGETGIGKTATVQHLSHVTGNKLVAINLSQQSEAGDLLGGFKPVNVRSMAIPLKDEFDSLFERILSHRKNQNFSEQLSKCIVKGQWKRSVALWRAALKKVDSILQSNGGASPRIGTANGEQQVKRRKIYPPPPSDMATQFENFSRKLEAFERQLQGHNNTFQFSFVEGKLITAVREGHWVLLDEINLASSDALECLLELLDSGPNAQPSIVLAETGDAERILAHPNFRVFAAMNPANDIGKKDLPLGIRSRFTEIFVDSPDDDLQSLRDIARVYTERLSPGDAGLELAVKVAELYQQIQSITKQEGLVDGSGQAAHFSLRTMTRALAHANVIASQCSIRRAIYEGFCLCFFTCLDAKCEARLQQVVKLGLFVDNKTIKAELKKSMRPPAAEERFVPVMLRIEAIEKSKKTQEERYWLPKGHLAVENPSQYIITPFVKHNLQNLIRAAFTGKYPVLIQGPTSAGKTSMVEYLAKRSGNKFVRINNHEHTDLQEYLGTYISTAQGNLVFQEGLLVQAVREGHWIVLDELNLAPTDVLEALNRLLDDNQEILIPETQETIRAHPNFMLFATQNPAGPYGGRKVLSRAFRNRFVELHFDDIPIEELNIILARRSNLPESWCSLIVEVYKRLSTLRQEQRLFEENSFATLRDLFRWAFRGADSVQQLAAHGYMLLAEKVRKEDERKSIKLIIEKTMSRKGVKVQIDEAFLYTSHNCPEMMLYDETFDSDIIWTRAMRRLFALVSHAVRHNEPVLLVGETGCGKTTVCQMFAKALGKDLHIVNAHQNTETGDLIGAQRPIRNRSSVDEDLLRDLCECMKDYSDLTDASVQDVDSLLETFDALDQKQINLLIPDVCSRISINRKKRRALFEWSDGSLVQAMRSGAYYLLDEISLAEDSVLERMNSVLDPQRSLLLAEKGSEDSLVVARDGFQFFATMNPGGDFGKKELSPALRNRFTEIWVPPLSDVTDVLQIVETRLSGDTKSFASSMVEFAQWFSGRYSSFRISNVSIRDLLAWIEFVNTQSMSFLLSVVHGAALVYIDTLGANPATFLEITGANVQSERNLCIKQLGESIGEDVNFVFRQRPDLQITSEALQIGPFSVNTVGATQQGPSFHFETPTTKLNAMRILRALQLSKPVLLEGSPGVGKTSIVTAIANTTGRRLTRINLSDQTDLMDLFGSDVPVENAEAGMFTWRDAPFLTAMKRGDWVLLDEMNLASQSVLEGLNACLDHRGEAYIAELDQTFARHPEFRLFAAQNPHHQGGGRKGLPASFVNRFTVVYVEGFDSEDLQLICSRLFPSLLESNTISSLIEYVTYLSAQTAQHGKFGAKGAPWEFNLRDILRWLQLLTSRWGLLPAGTAKDFFEMLVAQRFRTTFDVESAREGLKSVFQDEEPERHLFVNLSSKTAQIGLGLLSRHDRLHQMNTRHTYNFKHSLPLMESLMLCVQQNWPVILVGSSGAGKTSMLGALASMAGAELETYALNADIDATDLVGGFEQADTSRQIQNFLQRLRKFSLKQSRTLLLNDFGPHHSATLVKLFDLLVELRATAQDNARFAHLYNIFRQYSTANPSDEAAFIDQQFQTLSKASRATGSAKFEWVDGILVKALEHGHWLVLDNANLCSSSVLDRMNSLLEPDGSLIINEHCFEDGTAKVVKPHPSFRIFMTVDPQYGELSRAMRNRAVELFLPSLPVETNGRDDKMINYFSVEPYMTGFQDILDIFNTKLETHPRSSITILESAMERMSIANFRIWTSFAEQTGLGLVEADQKERFDLISKRLKISIQSFGATAASVDYYKFVGNEIGLEGDFYLSQPLHALVNQPLIAYGAVVAPQFDPLQLGRLQDVLLDLARMQQSLEASTTQGPSSEQATRLQRSVALKRSSNSAKESTTWVAPFLRNVHVAVLNWATNLGINSLATLQDFFYTISNIQSFWWTIYSLVITCDFDEARFRTVVIMGTEFVNTSTPGTPNEIAVIEDVARQFKGFGQAIQLTTGLSMEPLWRLFRPDTVRNSESLRSLLQLEAVADVFDKIIWKLRAPLDDIALLRTSIANAISLVYKQEVAVESVLKGLNEAIANLKVDNSHEDNETRPLYRQTFESICQHLDMQMTGKSLDPRLPPKTSHELHMLACRATTDIDVSLRESRMAPSLAKVAGFLQRTKGTDSAEIPREGWCSQALELLQKSKDVSLRGLDLLQVETDTLGKELARNAIALSDMDLSTVFSMLSDLVQAVLLEHKDSFNPGFVDQVTFHGLQSVLENAASQGIHVQRDLMSSNQKSDSRVKALMEQLIVPFYSFSSSQEKSSHKALVILAECFIAFSLVSLLLYVPDKPWDPALREKVQQEIHEQRWKHLKDQRDSYARLERIFTGRDGSLRGTVCEQDIDRLGPVPKLLDIPRPPHSRIQEIQIEFNNIVILVNLLYDSWSSGQKQGLEETSLTSNVSSMIRRLSSSREDYRDLTGPAIKFLQCLRTGLNLSVLARDGPEHDRNTIYSMLDYPFLSALPGLWVSDQEIPTFWHDTLPNRPSQEIQILTLRSYALRASVQDPASWPIELQRDLSAVLDSLFWTWKRQLEAGRKKAEIESSFYRYRGGEDHDDGIQEQEFNDLFPVFEESQQTSRLEDHLSSEPSIQRIASTIVDVVGKIFSTRVDTAKELESMIQYASKHVASDRTHSARSSAIFDAKKLLPIVFLQVRHLDHSLQSTKKASSLYNVYTDANIHEIKKLSSLVYEIQDRVATVLQTWPEHATLHNIMAFCSEILKFRHVEPIMKFLTKAEQLHNSMAEWQSVTSREYSTEYLFNKLTDVLVSWRQLELSTWAKLLDLENERCIEDSQAWWFVAYENICVIPEIMQQSREEMQKHAADIICILENFLKGSSLGQFRAKLQILESLRSLVSLSTERNALMSPVHDALENFVQYFARFDAVVSEKIKHGCKDLEKKVKEVLQLASWKDRNIQALKQSARASHRKLYRIIRKYRDFLSQPIDSFLQEETFFTGHKEVGDLKILFDESSLKRALEATFIYSAQQSRWERLPRRLKNVSSTVSAMQKRADIDAAVELKSPTARLEAFVDSLETSVEQLKKETPQTLTDDNASLVKHLLTRKRRLFADTLKEVRQMGLNSNPSFDVLAKQNSLGSTLSSMSALGKSGPSEVVGKAQDFLYSTVTLMPTVRQAKSNHHDDLNNSDLYRSVGYVESLFSMTLRQRNTFMGHRKESAKLDSLLLQAENVWSDGCPSVEASDISQINGLAWMGQVTMWLPTILRLSGDMLSAQAELGSLDFVDTLDELQKRADVFENLHTMHTKIPTLPPFLLSTEHAKFSEQFNTAFENLLGFVTEWKQEGVPQAARAVLDYLSSWLGSQKVSSDSGTTVYFDDQVSIQPIEFDQATFNVVDLALGAIQDVETVFQEISSPVEEEKNWLLHQGQHLDSLIKAFHIPVIAQAVQNILPLLYRTGLSEAEYKTNQLLDASASLTLVLPILKKYQQLVHEALERYAELHRATCRANYRLAKTFTIVAAEGFCKPAGSSGEQGSASDKLESGTGLGDGEGAEDISKDIGDEDDLSELAQDPENRNADGEMESRDDAVDVDDELEGATAEGPTGKDEEEADKDGDHDDDLSDAESQSGSVGGGEGGMDDDAEDAQDDEVGDVDDLGPSAVDEKLWDQAADEDKKTKDGTQSSKNVDEKDQAAAKDEEVSAPDTKENGGEDQGEEDADDQASEVDTSNQSDVGSIDDQGIMDPHVKESEGFDLPEDLQLDGDKDHQQDLNTDNSDDDIMKDGEEIEETPQEDEDNTSNADLKDDDTVTDPNNASEEALQDEDGREQEGGGGETSEEKEPEPEEDHTFGDEHPADADNEPGNGISNDNNQKDSNLAEPQSSAQGTGPDEANKNQTASESSAQRQTGAESQASNEARTAVSESISKGQQSIPPESRDKETIRKLGNMLEEWHRQQREIHTTSSNEQGEEDRQQGDQDVDMRDADFEHLPDEDAQADTQALGAATEDQAQALDDSMAVHSTEKEGEEEKGDFLPDANEAENDSDPEVQDQEATSVDRPSVEDLQQSGAFVGKRKDAPPELWSDDAESQKLEDVDDQLSTMQLQPVEQSPSRSVSPDPTSTDPLVIWHHHESRTHALSLALTSHLRLILAPTLATKLRGDFRTGKRLNIKRIIPYIASSYKRDKIWMRRSVPTKRAYQVMLAIDDSRSMAENSTSSNGRKDAQHNGAGGGSSSKDMAFDTLALISRGLSMLDVGEISVVGFGERVFVAHDFGSPFTSETGAQVLRRFNFQQQKTDVKRLVQESIEIFRDARAKSTAASSAELWQLELIVSDGICEDHEGIRRLLLQAREERIMVVFVIVDAAATSTTGKGQSQGQSIVDLDRVEFVQEGGGEGDGEGEGEMKMVRRKYLESFPFAYYLVVKDVRELPHVLATALRQWFAEVAER